MEQMQLSANEVKQVKSRILDCTSKERYVNYIKNFLPVLRKYSLLIDLMMY